MYLTFCRSQHTYLIETFKILNVSCNPTSCMFTANRAWSPKRSHTQLDDALRLVRGHSTGGTRSSSAKVRNTHSPKSQTSPSASYYRQNSDPLSKPYFNKYAHPSINSNGSALNGDRPEELHNKSLHNLNNSRTLFEQQLETYQQSLLEQQQKSLRDFNQQIMREISDENLEEGEEQNGGLRRSESLSSVDSLEDNQTNDTLRESCDLDDFMAQKQNGGVGFSNGGGGNGHGNGSRNVTFADQEKNMVRTAPNVSNGIHANGNGQQPQNIDSYHSQIQTLLNPPQKTLPTDQQKEQQYLQRQKEIQLQLKEQEQKRQQELQQKVLEQQRQQQQVLLQQQFEKQQQEQAQLEKQRRAVEQQQKQQQQENERKQNYVDDESQRPKAQMKAWGTPSPHPPTPASVHSTPTTLVTNASPYSGRSTNTNMTVPLYDKPAQSSAVNSPKTVVNASMYTVAANTTYNNSNMASGGKMDVGQGQGQPSVSRYDGSSAQDSSLSFLETVTNGISGKPGSSSKPAPSTSATSTGTVIGNSGYTTPSKSSMPVQQAVTSKPPVNQTTPKPTPPPSSVVATKPPLNPSHYGNSYGAAFAARQQQQQTSPATQGTGNGSSKANENGYSTASNSTASKQITMVTGPLPWGAGLSDNVNVMMTPNTALNGDDITDTDSVSTICDDRETEPKGGC